MVGDIPTLDATLISLPFADQCFTFNILLPKTNYGLIKLEMVMTGQMFTDIAQTTQPLYVQLNIPSIDIVLPLNLNYELKSVGDMITIAVQRIMLIV